MLTLEDWTTVLLGVTLDAAEVDNLIVELSLKADVKVTDLEVITKVDILDTLVGGALDIVGVGVFPAHTACLLTLRLAMFF